MDEELYDSLDEDIPSFSDIIKNYGEDSPRSTYEIPYDLCNLVPLYQGDVLKNNVVRTTKQKIIKSKIPVRSNYINQKDECTRVNNNNSSNNSTKKKLKKKSDLAYLKESKTYVKLFHERIGYPNKTKIEKPHDSTRAIDEESTYRTATSGSMDYFDARTRNSLTDSEENFYIKHIENDTVVPPLNLSNRNSCILFQSNSKPNINTSNFKSFTCQSLSKFANTRRDLSSKYSINVPLLGGLGPDIVANKDKLLLFQRRKEYGQNASNRNRLRILEGKLLNNFKAITTNIKNN